MVSVIDVGALFSGADIVQWMVDNLAGLETSEEAEKLGQLLLDKNTLSFILKALGEYIVQCRIV